MFGGLQAWIEVAKQAAAIQIDASGIRMKVIARIRVERWAASTSKLLAQPGGAALADVEAALAVGATIDGAAASVAFTESTAAIAALLGVQERSAPVLAAIRTANERSPEQVRGSCVIMSTPRCTPVMLV